MKIFIEYYIGKYFDDKYYQLVVFIKDLDHMY